MCRKCIWMLQNQLWLLLKRFFLTWRSAHIVWKSPKKSHFNFGVFHRFLSNLKWPVWQECLTWKLFKMSHLNFWILAFSTNFWSYIDLSGNTVWPQAKIDYFWHFWWTFVHPICKRSSLRSPCWMRPFSMIFKHCEINTFDPTFFQD